MFPRIAAIGFILAGTSVGWFILGGTIGSRTYESSEKLRSGVASIWGSPQEQIPPGATAEVLVPHKTEKEAGGHKTVETEMVKTPLELPMDSSRIQVNLDLDYRQKGLLWYSTYTVNFGGTYTYRNTTAEPHDVTFQLKFPAEQAIYDGVVMEVNGQQLPLSSDQHGAFVKAPLGAGETATLRVGYRSQGLESWRYKLGADVTQSRDFQLVMRTNFKDVDFPLSTLSPTEKKETAAGWDLTWKYRNLISGFQIGMVMPQKLQPGPLAREISYFAPVSLLLFFFLMFVITTIRRIDLHPMNYFFLATAFFSFHLLLAYLADRISIHLAFVICSAVSIFLVVTYLRLVTGLRFAVVEAGMAQLIYLVLFSYAFFIPGFTGLAVTIGCIVTLFVVMQMTGRIRWSERFAAPASDYPVR